MRWFPLLVLVVFAVVARGDELSAAPSIAKQLAPGVVYTQEIGSSLTINVLSIDLNVPGVRIDAAITGGSITSGTGNASNGRDTVRALVERTTAIAGVNADYFGGTGDPLGLGISQSELYSEPWTTARAAFGLDASGRSPFFSVLSYSGDLSVEGKPGRVAVNAIDRPLTRADRPDLVVYSQLYGPTSGARPGAMEVVVKGVNLPIQPNKLIVGTVDSVCPASNVQTTIPDDGLVIAATSHGAAGDFLRTLSPGDVIHFIAAIAPYADLSDASRLAMSTAAASAASTSRSSSLNRNALLWGNASTGVGGGPKLLTNGRIDIDAAAEGFDDGFAEGPHPRTAVGATQDGKVLLVTVEGKPGVSAGVSLLDLAGILLRFGAVNAINLDGGGSTTMAIRGLTVNYPNQGTGERRVADALLVHAPASSTPAGTDALIMPPDAPVTVGATCPLKCRSHGTIIDGSDPRVVWSGPATNGVGYVTQDGVFHALRPGTGEASALLDGQRVTTNLSVVGPAAPSEAFTASLKLFDSQSLPRRTKLLIRVTGSSGSPGAHMPLAVVVTGGSADQTTLVTDEDGLASTFITWTGEQGWITVTSSTTSPATVPQNAPAPARDEQQPPTAPAAKG
ncbi:MAG: phosphodiester glycosidase family protein [Capsulimonadaceae bacterium]|nr:phosphodiester glycosidase family protein [Capsulimonadaceae bacterium]